MPALIPFPATTSLLFRGATDARARLIDAIQSVLLRLLVLTPPGDIHFTFFDPVGHGQNVTPFLALGDKRPDLVNTKAWADSQQIEARLAELTDMMENIIQKYLRDKYEALADYNAEAAVQEPYRIVVALDFPTGFTETAARRLMSIAQNGRRCGVYMIVLFDPSKPLPHGFNIAELEHLSTIITPRGAGFVWEDEDFVGSALLLDTPPGAETFREVIKKIGSAAENAGKVEVPFERIAPPPDQWWTYDSSTELRVPLGPTGARQVQELVLNQKTEVHALVVGQVGSGKSTLLHALITGIALRYRPDEVECYLIDFKQGVEFKTYARNRLPHARVIAIESEREFGLSVLQSLEHEMQRRGTLFRSAAVQDLGMYRHATGERLPRLLLLVDEFQEFFTEDDSIASQSRLLLERLVLQGRYAGIHILLCTQTLGGPHKLSNSTMRQMTVRIALKCSEADSRLILADNNPSARTLSRPGEAIYNANAGDVGNDTFFQVAWLPDERRDDYLQQVTTVAKRHPDLSQRAPIVFEGNALARIDDEEKHVGHPLYALLQASSAPALARRSLAWLGDPLAIREPVSANVRRQSGSNLLIIGQNEEAALGMLTTALVSLAAQLPASGDNGPAAISVLDFGAVDGPYAEFFERLAGAAPHLIRFGRRRQLAEIVDDLSVEMQRRIDAEETAAPPRYLFLYGLHRARDLRQEESFGYSSYSDEPAPPNPAQQFTTLLREGPEVGVHMLAWCDTSANVNRTLERRTLREFSMRVVFQMSADDSSNLIDTPAASKLGQFRAIFHDEDEGRLERFRPYSVPSQEWLTQAIEKLAARA